ncbi:hypothetical protein HYC85_007907 [Camellia sinensis]|uniref:Uncharacterized protein n=1 Tax=Camellia sinensis TaxID=4442 RepID=A0A7J7HS58_CAMSI|nr:hypothetical protein HYC85_007907 [Camellia sinensis]
MLRSKLIKLSGGSFKVLYRRYFIGLCRSNSTISPVRSSLICFFSASICFLSLHHQIPLLFNFISLLITTIPIFGQFDFRLHELVYCLRKHKFQLQQKKKGVL